MCVLYTLVPVPAATPPASFTTFFLLPGHMRAFKAAPPAVLRIPRLFFSFSCFLVTGKGVKRGFRRLAKTVRVKRERHVCKRAKLLFVASVVASPNAPY